VERIVFPEEDSWKVDIQQSGGTDSWRHDRDILDVMFLVFPWRQAAAEQIVENSWISKIVKTSTSSFFFQTIVITVVSNYASQTT